MGENELCYLVTGTVPGREDLLYQGGSIENSPDGPVFIYYISTRKDIILIDSSFHFDDARVLGMGNAVKRNLPD